MIYKRAHNSLLNSPFPTHVAHISCCTFLINHSALRFHAVWHLFLKFVFNVRFFRSTWFIVAPQKHKKNFKNFTEQAWLSRNTNTFQKKQTKKTTITFFWASTQKEIYFFKNSMNKGHRKAIKPPHTIYYAWTDSIQRKDKSLQKQLTALKEILPTPEKKHPTHIPENKKNIITCSFRNPLMNFVVDFEMIAFSYCWHVCPSTSHLSTTIAVHCSAFGYLLQQDLRLNAVFIAIFDIAKTPPRISQ